jgi:DNA mismatch repair protein MutS2
VTSPDTHPDAATAAGLRARSLELLEFPRVREALAERTSFFLARERALALEPSYDPDVVAERQQETAEARALLRETGGVDLTLSIDPGPLVRRASVGGTLSGDELLTVAEALALTGRAKALGTRVAAETPLLRNVCRRIADLHGLEGELRAKLTPSGELRDDASPLLRELRRASREAYRRATAALDAVIGSELGAAVLQDALYTVRNERFVVPVKADFKGRLPGIVHGVSGSGETLFIEPLATVGHTNAWREATAAEGEEALRILRAMTALVGRRAGEIGHALELTARVDMALAKARYAQALNAGPVPLDAAHVHLDAARHPLLTGPVVPVSFAIAPPAVGLVITGPNTGGKTVALKTLGLLTLMHQAGLQVPAGPDTRLPLVDGVYADIGDQQSIDEAVSTFSSHMRNIAAILDKSTPESLVLLDEVGTSTDPVEGSALACAVLAHLAGRGVPVVATTHHRAVAALAEDVPELENASVELDPATLRPTYRLVVGLPGRSYALAVASRIGLDARVVEHARSLLDPAHVEAEALLASIQEERHRTRERLAEAEDAERRAGELTVELESRIAELERAQAEVAEQVRRELAEEARRVREQLKQAASAAEWQAFRSEPPPPRVLEAASDEVADVQRALRSRVWGAKGRGADKAPAEPRRTRIGVGDAVEIGSLGFTGTVVGEPAADGSVEVLVGSARIRMELGRLRKVGAAREPEPGRTRISLTRSKEAPLTGPAHEVDLRGLRLHEALERLDDFMDASLARGVGAVRIVHGKGTGALRSGIWRHLAGHPSVESYDYAPRDRGGDGATEVTLS